MSVSARPAAAQMHGFGAGAIVLDDSHGHTLTFESPQPGDPGYSDWLLNGPQLFKLAIPPYSGASMGFVMTGPMTSGASQVLIWDPPTSAGGQGGTQGVWRSTSLSTAIGAIGVVSGTGVTNSLPKWNGAASLGNSVISDNGGAISFGGYGAGVLHSDTSGAITSAPIALTSDVNGTLPASNGGTGQTTLAASFNALVPDSTNQSGKFLSVQPGGGYAWSATGAGTGNGTVTSVDVSGGTTGITATGGPVTSNGTITLGGTLAVSNGGTGQTTPAAALNGLMPDSTNQAGKFFSVQPGGGYGWSAAGTGNGTVSSVDVSGGTTGLTTTGGPVTANGTITLAGTLAVSNGGTGQTTQAAAFNSLVPDSTNQAGKFLSVQPGGGYSWSSVGTGNGTVTSVNVSGGTTGLTTTGGPVTANGSIALTGTVNAASGGTGQSSYNTGDMLYATSSTTLSTLPVGGSNQVLGVSGGVPAWITNGATITNTTNTPTAISVGANDYTVDASSTYIRLSNISGGPIDITGINSTGVTDGRVITLVNTSANALIIKNQDPGSSTNNQFDLPGGADILLGQKGAITLIYDSALHFWEVVSTN